jgi:hypothetical protein
MIKGGKNLSFPFKAPHALRVTGKRFAQDLQRHVSLETWITGSIDFSHATGTKKPHDFIRANSCTCSE